MPTPRKRARIQNSPSRNRELGDAESTGGSVEIRPENPPKRRRGGSI